MKRVFYTVLMIVILSTAASALVTHDTGINAKNPDFYYDYAAFETEEALAKADMNSDGDMKDTVIQYYNINKGKVFNTSVAGKNPSLFGFLIAFESSELEQGQDLNADGDTLDNVIVYYDINEKKLMSTTAMGHNPSIHASELIAFSTPEIDMGVDYNNDGDQLDDIIRYYKLDTKEIVNTKMVGENPSISDRFIIFLTSEAQAGEDLNNDDDKSDKVVRFVFLDTGKAVNTFEHASEVDMNGEHKAAFVQDGSVVFYDVMAQELVRVDAKGSGVSVSEKYVVFRDPKSIFVYDFEKKVTALAGINGEYPIIFDDKIVFTRNGLLQHGADEDSDEDGVPDFADNCREIANEDQQDKDNDFMGDACDEDLDVVPKDQVKKGKTDRVKPEAIQAKDQIEDANASQDAVEEEGSSFKWIFLLLVIAASVAGIVYAIVMHRRKVRGFGF